MTPHMDGLLAYLLSRRICQQRIDLNSHGIFYSCNYLRFDFKEVRVFVVKIFLHLEAQMQRIIFV
jgi:hypothetical protein